MDANQIVDGISQVSLRNETLNFLPGCDRPLDSSVIKKLMEVIECPDSIDDTNAFSSLLSKIGDDSFIPPLIRAISAARVSESLWLADYMYVLIELLDQCKEYYAVEGDFVHRLGDWLFNTNGNEISWKSSDILSEVLNPMTREYLIKGAVDSSLLSMTRISCLRGIVNHYPEEFPNLFSQLENDPEVDIRDAASDARDHLLGGGNSRIP